MLFIKLIIDLIRTKKIVLYVTLNYDNKMNSIFQMRVVRVLGFTTQGMDSFLKSWNFYIQWNSFGASVLFFGVEGHHYTLGFDQKIPFLAT
jgi:hypothetical protein